MVGGGGRGYTNINNNKTQHLEFEVVTGCSLSPRQDTEGLSTEEEGSQRLYPLQRLLQSDQSHQEPLMATSQTTRVTGEEPRRNTELTAGGLEDSLTVLGIKVNLHRLIQQILVYTGELGAQVSNEK